MKICKATTTAPILVSPVLVDGASVLLDAGAEVTAILFTGADAAGYHINAQVDGRIYDGYASASSLDGMDVIANINGNRSKFPVAAR